MKLKNVDEFPKCKDCELSEIDYDKRSESMTCFGCQYDYALSELEKGIFLPVIKWLNMVLLRVNNWLTKNDGNKL